MPRFIRTILLVPMLVALATSALSLEVPSIFGDHMVLQRGADIPVWGTAEPGAEVHVECASRSAVVAADGDGNWRAVLSPLDAGGPHTLSIRSDGAEIAIGDVLVGEVWLCSGQSNMRFKVREHVSGSDIAALADFPDIRLFMMDYKVSSRDPYTDEQLRRMAENEYAEYSGWSRCSPESVREFSAVAFFFGQRLHRDLGVPVGLVSNGVGASPAQAWTPAGDLAAHPQLREIVAMWEDLRSPNSSVESRARSNLSAWLEAVEVARSFGEEPPPQPEHPFRPGYLFEQMVEPIVPFAIRGVLWYQGEANAQAPQLYGPLFTAMVQSWRARWNRPDLPFFYAQLPNYNNSSWPEMRDVQRQLERQLTDTGMAITIDCGTFDDIHPPDKREVARRFALLALSRVYGRDLVDSGPLPSEAVRTGDGVRVDFLHAGTGLAGSQPQFELVYEDGRRTPAVGSIDGGAVLIPLSAGESPSTVRYAWSPWPETTLRNSAGLPASPFELPIAAGSP